LTQTLPERLRNILPTTEELERELDGNFDVWPLSPPHHHPHSISTYILPVSTHFPYYTSGWSGF
jgi:hypothetical protein